MNQNDIKPLVRTLIAWGAFALAGVACAKLFGFNVPVPGTVETDALVAVALGTARLP
jgi:hypothetical protein